MPQPPILPFTRALTPDEIFTAAELAGDTVSRKVYKAIQTFIAPSIDAVKVATTIVDAGRANEYSDWWPREWRKHVPAAMLAAEITPVIRAGGQAIQEDEAVVRKDPPRTWST